MALVGYISETALKTSINSINTSHDCVCLLAVRQLVLVALLNDSLLRSAAAVLNGLNDVAVTHVDGVDNSLSREANLTTNLVNSRLNAADSVLQAVEITVKIASKLANSTAIAFDSIHEKVAVLIV